MTRDGADGEARVGGAGRTAIRRLLGLALPLFANVAPVSVECEINTVTPNVQAHADVAMSSIGSAVVAWDSASTGPGGTDTSGRSPRAQRIDEAGGVLGDQYQVNEAPTGDQWLPAVAMAPDGRFAIAWQKRGSLGDDASLDGVQARLFWGRRLAPLDPRSALPRRRSPAPLLRRNRPAGGALRLERRQSAGLSLNC